MTRGLMMAWTEGRANKNCKLLLVLLHGCIFSKYIHKFVVGQDSSVGIASRYGPDSSGIESWLGGEIFRTRPDRPWAPPSLLYSGYRVFPRGKVAGAWRWLLSLWAFVACSRENFTFTFLHINLSVQIEHHTKLQKYLVHTISFEAVMTGWTLVTYERGEGQKFLPQLGCRHRMKRPKFPFLTYRGGPAWTLNSVSFWLQRTPTRIHQAVILML
jgi:hypothetical protein